MESHFVATIRSLGSQAWWRWCEVWSEKDQVAIAALTLSVVLVAGSWFYARINGDGKKGRHPLPPGPRGLPIVGNLPFIEQALHSYFAKLSQTHGTLIKLQLGNKTCVIASSPSTAKEILKDHDAIFANRYVPLASSIITYGVKDLAFAPYDQTWRMLRKFCVKEMMCKKSLDALYGLRRSEVRKTICYINSEPEVEVNVGDQMFLTMLNLIMNMLWGGTLKGEEREVIGAEFRHVVGELGDIFKEPNLSDFFPFLAPFDLQGVKRRMIKLFHWFDGIYESVINQRYRAIAEEQGQNKEYNDFLQILLRAKEEGDPKTPMTMDNIKAMLFDMVFGGTDTTSSALEWAMAEMMQHPEIMRKAQEELDEVVGLNNVVEETHLPRLHYLNAVLKEVHRLHPLIPLLVARQPSESCVIGGYTVPKDSQVFINAWAIHRDPTIWDNPLKFQPERFLGFTDNKWDYSGNDYRYIPFGSGRRICVGLPLADRMLPYVLASLIHSFDWRLPQGAKLDLGEKFEIFLKKATPLVAIPCPRLSNPHLYA